MLCDAEENIAKWREQIVEARIRLTDDAIPSGIRRLLWAVVECRETCIALSGADLDLELEVIDCELEKQLRSAPVRVRTEAAIG